MECMKVDGVEVDGVEVEGVEVEGVELEGLKAEGVRVTWSEWGGGSEGERSGSGVEWR